MGLLMKSWWKSLTQSEKSMYGGITFILLLSIFALFSDDLFNSSRSRSGDAVGVVTQTSKDVRFKSPDQIGWQPTKVTQDAFLGETYFTGPDSTTKIKLQDGTEIALEPNSMITLTKLDNQVNLNLEFGRVKAVAAPRAKVKIQGRTIAGNFEVQKRELKKVKVDLKWITKPPLEIVHFNNNVSMNLAWNKIPEAQGYVVETSQDPKFEVNVLRTLTRGSSQAVTAYPKAGLFYTRIIALGSKNEELSVSEAKASTAVSQYLPKIQTPVDGESIPVAINFEEQPLSKTEILLRWTTQGGSQAESFEIENLKGEKFRSSTSEFPLMIKKLGAQTIKVRGLFGSLRKPGPWSEPITFNVVAGQKLNLGTPNFISTSIDHDSSRTPYPNLEWTPVDGARRYEIQFSTNTKFKNVSKVITGSTKLQLTSKNLGLSFARVRSVSGKSVSPWSDTIAQINITSQLVRAQPTPPRIVFGKSPEDQGQPETFELQWTPSPGVKKYKVEISDSTQFKKKQVVIAQGTKTSITMKKPGELYWRIKPLDNQKRSIASFNEPLPIIYQLKVPLSTPILTSKSQRSTVIVQDRDAGFPITLSWREVRQAEKYEVQVSQDKNFEQIFFQTTTQSPNLEIKQELPGGLIFWRVRALGENSKMSNWSKLGAFETRSGKIPSRWANGEPP